MVKALLKLLKINVLYRHLWWHQEPLTSMEHFTEMFIGEPKMVLQRHRHENTLLEPFYFFFL